jgi:hypothetical protein
MDWKDTLDAYAEADSPHRKTLTRQLAAAAHYHAFEGLDTFLFSLTLLQPDMYANGVSRAECGVILAKL